MLVFNCLPCILLFAAAFLFSAESAPSRPTIRKTSRLYAFSTGPDMKGLDSTSETNLLNTQSTKTSELVESVFNIYQNVPNDSKDSLLRSIKEKGQKLLERVRRPTNKDEAWKYTNVKALFGPLVSNSNQVASHSSQEILNQYIDEACKESCLVFIDGKYNVELSSTSQIDTKSLEVLHFSSDRDSGMNRGLPEGALPSFLNDDHYVAFSPDTDELRRNSYGSDALCALNMAACSELTVLRCKSGMKHLAPVQLIHLTTSASCLVSPRLLIVMEQDSDLNIKQSFIGGVEKSVDEASATVINSNTRILLAERANLEHLYLQELSDSSRHLEVLSSQGQVNSSYTLKILQMGGTISRFNAHLDLKQSGSNCSISCVALANEKQSMDLHSSILHDTESAISRQQQRNVIGDKGEVIFKGKIKIPQHAQLTDSDQLCRTLMLGKRARIIAMPTLEITADNVVCSHGASVADMDENSMFYLSARGINRKEARKLLLIGFALEPFGDNQLGGSVMSRIVKKLEKMNPTDETRELGFDANQAMTSM